MNLESLGQLHPHPDIDDWLVSNLMPVEYFDGLKLQFIIENIQDEETPEDFEHAIKSFLSLSGEDRPIAAQYIFQYYQRTIQLFGLDVVGLAIPESSIVWQHIQVTEIYVTRRYYADKGVYLQVICECDWEPEHGLQLVFRKGNILSRVSGQDGHLATADAYALPESQNTIVYQGQNFHLCNELFFQ